MRIIITILICFISISPIISQYSIHGFVGIPYSDDSIMPISNIDIYLLEKDRVTLTDAMGKFDFNNIEKGTYSIKIGGLKSSYNKLLITNIQVTHNVTLDSIIVIVDYSNPSWMSLGRVLTVNGLKNLYAENGQFELDTVTSNFYDHGLYRERQSINDPSDSVWRFYRQGTWKNDNYILNYDHGRLNGEICKLDSSKQNITCRGYYKNDQRNGLWTYYHKDGKIDFSISYIDDFLIIDQNKYSIKDYNSNIWRMYNY